MGIPVAAGGGSLGAVKGEALNAVEAKSGGGGITMGCLGSCLEDLLSSLAPSSEAFLLTRLPPR
jgi:hypothetical protein